MSKFVFIFSAFFLLTSIIYYRYSNEVIKLFLYISKNNTNESENEFLFTIAELQHHDGITSKLLYLSLLGKVYDVTKGKKHYGSGSTYNFFVGKDASRSFITGQFENQDNGVQPDDVLDLSDEALEGLIKWTEMYDTQYSFKGKLIGRYYDQYGQETDYLKQLRHRVQALEENKLHEMNLQTKYPFCNIEWDVDIGTRVWCSKKSGGIERDWVGVPRQFYQPGSSEARCACVDYSDSRSDLSLIKEYKDCPINSASCYVDFDDKNHNN